ncbi:MAG: hypothetical protein R2690_18320 [Acidimicrobiales bacterium]
MSREGRAVSASAAAVTEQVDYDALRYQDGRIDVAAVQAVQDPLAGASSTFAAAQAAMADQRGRCCCRQSVVLSIASPTSSTPRRHRHRRRRPPPSWRPGCSVPTARGATPCC